MQKYTHLLLLSLLAWSINSLSMDRPSSQLSINTPLACKVSIQKNNLKEKLSTKLSELRLKEPDMMTWIPKKKKDELRKTLDKIARSNNKPIVPIVDTFCQNFTGKSELFLYGQLRTFAQALYVQHLLVHYLQLYVFHEKYMWQIYSDNSITSYKSSTSPDGRMCIGISSNNAEEIPFLIKYQTLFTECENRNQLRRLISTCLCSDLNKINVLGRSQFYFFSSAQAIERQETLIGRLMGFYLSQNAENSYINKIGNSKIYEQHINYLFEAFSYLTEYSNHLLAQKSVDESIITKEDQIFYTSLCMICQEYKASYPFLSKLYNAIITKMNLILENNNNVSMCIGDKALSMKACNVNVDKLYDPETAHQLPLRAFLKSDLVRACSIPCDILNHIERILMTQYINDQDRLPESLPIFRFANSTWVPLSSLTIEQELLDAGVDEIELQNQKKFAETMAYLRNLPSKAIHKPTITTDSSKPTNKPTVTTDSSKIKEMTTSALAMPETPQISTIKPIETTIITVAKIVEETDDVICFLNHSTGCKEIILKLKIKNPAPDPLSLVYTQYVLKWLNNPNETMIETGFTNPTDERAKYFRECPWAPIAFHAFSQTIDTYIKQYGACSKIKNNMHIKIPGIMMYPKGKLRDGKSEETGVYHYIIDLNNNQCFHRMFTPVPSEYFLKGTWMQEEQSIMDNTALYNTMFPRLPTKK